MYKPLYGKIDGEIKFMQDAIIYRDYRIDLSEVRSIDFNFVDYRGQYKFRSNANFDQLRSRGVKNTFEYTDLEGDTYAVYFRLQDKTDHKNLQQLIDHYYRLGKISSQRRYELQNTSYF